MRSESAELKRFLSHGESPAHGASVCAGAAVAAHLSFERATPLHLPSTGRSPARDALIGALTGRSNRYNSVHTVLAYDSILVRMCCQSHTSLLVSLAIPN